MAIEQSPAFQFYVKEWRSSRAVSRMTFAQRGMYLEMLLEQWENQSLPDSPTECAHIIGGTEQEWIDAWPVLRRNFVDRRGAGRPRKNSDPVTIGRIVNLRLERVRKEKREHVKKARSGGITRALTATRGKSGTYLPASEPATNQQGVQLDSQQEVQPPTSTASATASATPTASASAVVPKRPTTRGTLVTPPRAFAHTAHFSQCGDVPQWLHSEFVRKLQNTGLDDAAADKRAFAFYADTEAQWVGQVVPDEPRVFWRARFTEAFAGPVVGSVSPRTAGNRAGLDRFAARAGK